MVIFNFLTFFMRKILLFFVILFSFFSISYAKDSTSSIFKIYNYSYDKLNNMYFIDSYGSAIYIWDNKVITNAHVLSNNEWKYEWLYEVCETINYKEEPNCFSAWDLLYYNEEKDLAILSLDDSPSKSKKVIFSDDKVSIWDTVTNYWYPSNWGNTITFTSWKISWFLEWYYKIDANLDSGSSGWGAFDSNWNLIWMNIFVSDWYTTLWYLIPWNDIEDFLNKKGDITYHKWKKDNNFSKFLTKYKNRINSNFIKEDYIEVKNISKYWYKIFDSMFDESWEMKYYFLTSKSLNTEIIIWRNILSFYKDFDFEDFIKMNKLLKYSFSNWTELISWEIYINWKIFYTVYNYNNKTKDIVFTFINESWIKINVYWNLERKSELKNAFNLIFNDISFKEAKKVSKLSLDWLKIWWKSNWYFSKDYDYSDFSISTHWYNIFSPNNYLYLNVRLDDIIPTSKINKNAYIKLLKNSNFEFFKTKKGNILLYKKTVNKNITIHYFSLLKEYNNNIYFYDFYFSHIWNKPFSWEVLNFFNNLDHSFSDYFNINDLWENITSLENSVENFDKVEHSSFNSVKTLENNHKEKLLSIFKQILWYNNNLAFPKGFKNKTTSDNVESISKKYEKNNIKAKSLLTKDLIISKNNLRKVIKQKKTISKIDSLVIKLDIKKLESLYTKLDKINLKLAKFKKYKDLLTYLKAKVWLEIHKRNESKKTSIKTEKDKKESTKKNIVSLKKDNNKDIMSKNEIKDNNIKVNTKINVYEDKNRSKASYFLSMTSFDNSWKNISFFADNLRDLSSYEAYLNGEKIANWILLKNWQYILDNPKISNLWEWIHSFYIKNVKTEEKSYTYYIYFWKVIYTYWDYLKCNLWIQKATIHSKNNNFTDSVKNYYKIIDFKYDFKWNKLEDWNYYMQAHCWYLDSKNKKWWYVWGFSYTISNGELKINTGWIEYIDSWNTIIR